MRFGILLACLAATPLMACGSSFDDYCTKETNCLGGNDKDKQACVDSAETAKKEASDFGCSSQFSDLQNCATASAVCNGGQFSSAGCDSQSTALQNCEKAASAENKALPGH
jgi:hypothetical protein